MATILGLDLGSNSIGWAVRETTAGNTLQEQLLYYGVTRFEKGVGEGKSGEFSFAAQRTGFRSTRRLYQSRKYRIWATLEVLINNGLCPLSIDDLDRWRKYDKSKGLKREYPVDCEEFEQWVRLDFDNDKKPDYTNPYEIRHILATEQLDLDKKENRYMLGRALYHIAQRRGFRSSKGETIATQEEDNLELNANAKLKKSEEKKAKQLLEYMEEKINQKQEVKTIGSAFYFLTQEGIRVRKDYQAVRAQYRDEVDYIFDFQEQLSKDSTLYKQVIQAIFFQRPLRSQKGSVGKCTLEPTKTRCPQSHPDFEYFRAWTFINNIKYKTCEKDIAKPLDLELKQELYKDKFIKVGNFKFKDIQDYLKKKLGNNTIFNYKEDTSISGSPLTYYFRKIFGDDWRNIEIKKNRINNKTGEIKQVSYNWEDLWHICFTFDNDDCFIDFVKNTLDFDEQKTNDMYRMWGKTSTGYAMLSLKAIRNINRFLGQGFIYSDAVLLAKVPEIIGEGNWKEHSKQITEVLKTKIKDLSYQRKIVCIANNLISKYKALEIHDQFANKNYDYALTDSDKESVKQECELYFGEKTWKELENKEKIQSMVEEYYQTFFNSSSRSYFSLPNIGDTMKKYLQEIFSTNIDVEKLYHHSDLNCYSPAKKGNFEFEGTMMSAALLGSPSTDSFRNPMAMRMLHILRNLVNYLLKRGIIDERTKIVVETARQLNDSNMRWAIENYQKEKEKENDEIKKILAEYNHDVTSEDLQEKVKLLADNYLDDKIKTKKEDKFKADLEKYKLAREQKFQCIYTGRVISLSDLLGDSPTFDIEHTLPQSKTLNNSLANKTICDSYYNRYIKKNLLPTQLPNYEKDCVINGKTYPAILPKLEQWKEKINNLEKRVEFWKGKAKSASTKDAKDSAIRQKHMWKMELDYWKSKLKGFTIAEITSGFTNRNLVDTHLISKYAVLYLKTAFNSVEVQKGEVTAEFRKLLGIQPADEKKDRTNHYHHAIDATILTVVPYAAKREEILSLYGEKLDKKKLGQSTQEVDAKLCKCIASLNIGNKVSGIVDTIKENIVVFHKSKDVTLTPSKKKIRVRGKIVKGSNNKPLYRQGDSIRGELHSQTYYGAIELDGEISYVTRRDLVFKKNDRDPGFKSWDDLSKAIVNKELIAMMRSQFPENTSFKDACEKGIYMINKEGVKVNRIRHIRCKVSSKNPTIIKTQTYKSRHEYKQVYYVEKAGIYGISKYTGNKKTEYIVWTRKELAQQKEINNIGKELIKIPKVILDKKGVGKLKLDYTLRDGLKVIVLSKSESKDKILAKLQTRLYIFKGAEKDGRVRLLSHLYSGKDGNDKDIKGLSINDYNNLPIVIRQTLSALNLLVEGKDFVVTPLGEIRFL